MAINKIKNNDTVNHIWCGQLIEPGQYYTIQGPEKNRWANDPLLLEDIRNGTAIVNNEESDIVDPIKAINYLQDNLSVKINNSTVMSGLNELNFTGYVSVNPDEIGKVSVNITMDSNSVAYCLFNTSFVENGSAQNKWLDNNCQNVNSNATLFVIPFNATIVGVTFSNSNPAANFDIEIYKSTTGNGILDKVKIYTWEIRNKRIGYINNFTYPISMVAGDKIAVYIKDQGVNPYDPVVNIYFKISVNGTGTFTENFNGDF